MKFWKPIWTNLIRNMMKMIEIVALNSIVSGSINSQIDARVKNQILGTHFDRFDMKFDEND